MIQDAALWAEFAAESEEHLDVIEAVLGSGAADRPAVDRLFRAFHSLKGMSDALGAPGMKQVAHRCEDLLGLARNGRVAIPSVAEALLAAVDVLRRQRATVLDSQADAPAPPALLARLGAMATNEAPPPPPPAGPPPAPLGAADALRATLASRAAAAAPLLARLVTGRDALARAEAMELAEAAALIGLDRLAQLLAEFSDAAGTEPALALAGRLRRALQLLASASGEDAGAEALTIPVGLVAPRLGPRLVALAHRLEAVMQGAPAAPAAREAAEAARIAAAFDLPGLEQLLLLAEDVADRSAEPDGAEALATEAPRLADRLRAIADGPAAGYGAATEALAGAAAADPRLPGPWLPLLGPSARRRTLAALDAGRVLLRLRLASGLPAAAEAKLMGVLTAHAEVLTSRTVLDATPPHLDMLLAGPETVSELAAALAAADPGGAVLELGRLGAAPPSPPASPVTLRVRQETVDEIINLEAEVRAAALAVSEALEEGGGPEQLRRLAGLARRLPAGPAADLSGLVARLSSMQAALTRAEARLSLGMRRLDEAVMELRVVPVGSLFARLPRVVRAVAQASGREVELELDGEDVTIDRSLVELLADPLLHLVRNAVDHGVELPAARLAAGKPARAVLRVRAARLSGQVLVSVADDGRGLDHAAILARAVARGVVSAAQATRLSPQAIEALLFRPGFSTAEVVTETSGRGVGLDVVQDAVRRVGGTVEIDSRLGAGTRFTLHLPLTAAVQPVLLVEAGGQPYALPAARVEAVLAGDAAPGCETVALAAVLGLAVPDVPGALVLLRAGGRSFGLAVDRVQRRTDLLLRPLHPALAALPGVGGVGMLGNGDPVIVLEPDGLLPAA